MTNPKKLEFKLTIPVPLILGALLFKSLKSNKEKDKLLDKYAKESEKHVQELEYTKLELLKVKSDLENLKNTISEPKVFVDTNIEEKLKEESHNPNSASPESNILDSGMYDGLALHESSREKEKPIDPESSKTVDPINSNSGDDVAIDPNAPKVSTPSDDTPLNPEPSKEVPSSPKTQPSSSSEESQEEVSTSENKSEPKSDN